MINPRNTHLIKKFCFINNKVVIDDVCYKTLIRFYIEYTQIDIFIGTLTKPGNCFRFNFDTNIKDFLFAVKEYLKSYE
jgi:hypothetical protein